MSDGAHITDGGNWLQVLHPIKDRRLRPALFLDRDGVVVDDPGYLSKPEDVVLLPGAAAAIAAINRAGWPVIVNTNQSGVGRGYFGWSAFAAVQAAVSAQLARHGAHLDMVIACPYHPEAEGPFRRGDHPWQKPRTGMIEAAAKALPIDLASSWIVGDRARDLVAGRDAGLAGAFHVLTGHGRSERAEALASTAPGFTVVVVDGLGDVPAAMIRLGVLPNRDAQAPT